MSDFETMEKCWARIKELEARLQTRMEREAEARATIKELESQNAVQECNSGFLPTPSPKPQHAQSLR